MKRTIIKIDEALCNGCGACVTGCHEGALQMIGGKAVMVSELYCDGLGACIGDCPVGAITLEEREAEPYNEEAVMERIAPRGEPVILAHLKHLKDHGELELLRQGVEYLDRHGIDTSFLKSLQSVVTPAPAAPATGCSSDSSEPLGCGCPGSMAREIRPRGGASFAQNAPQGLGLHVATTEAQPSELRQFPVQLHLLNPAAGFLQGVDLLLAADCTAFARGDFHSRFLRGKALAIACPKLDSNIPSYVDKLVQMIDQARIDTLTVLVMEVPCCRGLVQIAERAREQATRKVPVKVVVLAVNGEVKSDQWI